MAGRWSRRWSRPDSKTIGLVVIVQRSVSELVIGTLIGPLPGFDCITEVVATVSVPGVRANRVDGQGRGTGEVVVAKAWIRHRMRIPMDRP